MTVSLPRDTSKLLKVRFDSSCSAKWCSMDRALTRIGIEILLFSDEFTYWNQEDLAISMFIPKPSTVFGNRKSKIRFVSFNRNTMSFKLYLWCTKKEMNELVKKIGENIVYDSGLSEEHKGVRDEYYTILGHDRYMERERHWKGFRNRIKSRIRRIRY